jgi:hypothetical protein
MKYQTGDKVRVIKGRVPKWVRDLYLQHTRTRTIQGSVYIESQEHRLYQIWGDIPYSFRASQLIKVNRNERRKIGRPREKRQYRRRQG